MTADKLQRAREIAKADNKDFHQALSKLTQCRVSAYLREQRIHQLTMDIVDHVSPIELLVALAMREFANRWTKQAADARVELAVHDQLERDTSVSRYMNLTPEDIGIRSRTELNARIVRGNDSYELGRDLDSIIDAVPGFKGMTTEQIVAICKDIKQAVDISKQRDDLKKVIKDHKMDSGDKRREVLDFMGISPSDL